MSYWYQMPTNFSGTNVSGVADFFIKFPSYVLNDYLGLGIVLLIWVTSFALSLGSGSRKALMTSSFIAFVFSIYFIRLSAMNMVVSIILIVLTIIGAIGSKDDNY